MNARSPLRARLDSHRCRAAIAIAAVLLMSLAAGSPALAARSSFSAKLRQAQLASLLEPQVTNVVPNAGPISGGTLVSIGGNHLSGATAVSFGSTPASSFSVKSDGKIEAITAPGTEGRVDVTVTTPEGTSAVNKGDHFTYVPPGPYVTEVRPDEGSVEGGHPVKIIGVHLGGATEVTFGGTPAAFEVVSSEGIEVTTPVGDAPVVDVRVTTPEGTSPPNPGDKYTYLAKFIEISKVTPNKGPAAGGGSVAIDGEGFHGVTAVEFDGVPAQSFVVNSPFSITAVPPPHSAGRTAIDVQTTFGPSEPEYCRRNKVERTQCSVRDYYKYKEPTVATVAPGAGPVAGGTPVTITGTGFAIGEAGTEVLFNKAPASSVDCSSDTTCTAVTPPAAKPSTAYLKVTVTTNETTHSKKNPTAKFVYE